MSHDLILLEKAVNNIAEVAGGTLLKYVSCTYSKFLDEKEFRAKAAQVCISRIVESRYSLAYCESV